MNGPEAIPVAHTPPGGWRDHMPPPILAGCTDPLLAGAPDLRGLWQVVSVDVDGQLVEEHPVLAHVERIEQCADRVVVTSAGIIHDMRADGTVENGVHDVMQIDFSTPVQVVATFESGVLVLRPVGLPGIEVTRWRHGDQMVWSYGGAFVARLERIGRGPGRRRA
jgi:hypothetical protein